MQFHLRLEKIKNSQNFSKILKMFSKCSQNVSKVLKSLEKIKISQNFSKVLKSSQKSLKSSQIYLKMSQKCNSIVHSCHANGLKFVATPIVKTYNIQFSPGLKKIKSSQKFSNRNVHARKNTFAWCRMRIFFSVHARVRARVYAVGRVAWLNCKQHILSGNETNIKCSQNALRMQSNALDVKESLWTV